MYFWQQHDQLWQASFFVSLKWSAALDKKVGLFCTNKKIIHRHSCDNCILEQMAAVDVHFLGLLSDGGVHAHIEHIKALVDAGEDAGIRGYIQGFTDGRDVDPKSGAGFIQDLTAHCAGKKTQFATLVGRYYAMDLGGEGSCSPII